MNVSGVDRDLMAGAERLNKAIAAETDRLGDGGRVLVRASGTEPLVRVMVEAETEDEAADTAARLAAVVADELALDHAGRAPEPAPAERRATADRRR